MSLYMLMNVVLTAYILGTVTLLMVKSDERSGVYRDRVSLLKEYSELNSLPEDLQEAMRHHIDLHSQVEHTADEKVLAIYPTAISRKVLRHLYAKTLSHCYLFAKNKAKFLDTLLASCRTDLFTADVQLISEGDIVSDLFIIIDGQVEISSGGGKRLLSSSSAYFTDGSGSMSRGKGSFFFKGDASGSMRAGRSNSVMPADGSSSMRGASRDPSISCGKKETRGPSDCFGEVAFFSESPSGESVWSSSIVRVLVISKATYDMLQASYPNEISKVLSALKHRAEALMRKEIEQALALESKIDAAVARGSKSLMPLTSALKPYLSKGKLTTTDLPPNLLNDLKSKLPPAQAAKFNQLVLSKASVDEFFAKQEVTSMIAMLDAASKGDEAKVQRLLNRGVSPSCCDYDKRTPLMVAAQEGKDAIVKLLLANKADIHVLDMFGNNALVRSICLLNPHSPLTLRSPPP